MLTGVENCCRIALAERAEDALRYVGSRSTTTTSPENRGWLDRKYAMELPTTPPPTMTICRVALPPSRAHGHRPAARLP